MKLNLEKVLAEFEEKEMAESENFDIVGVFLSEFELTGYQVKLLPELLGMVFRKLDSHDLRQNVRLVWSPSSPKDGSAKDDPLHNTSHVSSTVHTPQQNPPKFRCSQIPVAYHDQLKMETPHPASAR